MKIPKIFLTIILVAVFLFFASLLYRTVILIFILLIWRKPLAGLIPEKYRRWTMRAVWATMILLVWVALPRWRIDTSDRVRLIYFDKNGQAVHPPLSQYLLNVLIPESEVVNLGITAVKYAPSAIGKLQLATSLVNQAQNDIGNGKIGNFFSTYRSLGLNTPMSGGYAQMFNDNLGTDDRAFYLCNPVNFNSERTYSLVVFCHGYMGNWQLYQGIWKGLENAVVMSIGTKGISGIFSTADINNIFDFYMPMLERMGYKIDRSKIHLMGLSIGGSAVNAAVSSPLCAKFKSTTFISCGLKKAAKYPWQINFIGGGRDGMATGMPSRCQQLKSMGVDADIFFDPDDNHYVLVNHRKEIINFLNKRFEL